MDSKGEYVDSIYDGRRTAGMKTVRSESREEVIEQIREMLSPFGTITPSRGADKTKRVTQASAKIILTFCPKDGKWLPELWQGFLDTWEKVDRRIKNLLELKFNPFLPPEPVLAYKMTRLLV
ncbi:MAG: hypothetical protein ACREF5_03270 [Candidatus Saccharimonadales bacterium]